MFLQVADRTASPRTLFTLPMWLGCSHPIAAYQFSNTLNRLGTIDKTSTYKALTLVTRI